MSRDKCEVCESPAYAVISYWRAQPPERIRHPVCQEHGKIIWNAMSAPLRETAIIEEVAV